MCTRSSDFPFASARTSARTSGRKFAAANDSEFVRGFETVCRHPDVDFVDVCTLPDFRLDPLRICAQARKPLQVQKPIATTLDIAREMVDIARTAKIPLGVVSQHRFDDSSQFVHAAIRDGRLGRLLQCDAYVKWYRSPEVPRAAGEGQLEG